MNKGHVEKQLRNNCPTLNDPALSVDQLGVPILHFNAEQNFDFLVMARNC